jgi:hypothetical protein
VEEEGVSTGSMGEDTDEHHTEGEGSNAHDMDDEEKEHE